MRELLLASRLWQEQKPILSKMVIKSKRLSYMESFHCCKADRVHQGKLFISVRPDNIERFSLFSLPDAVNPRLAFIEFLNNPKRCYMSNAVEKQCMRFRNNVVGCK